MPDWRRLVRDRLPALHVRPERESEIVAELALQLEQAYTDAVAGGAGEEEALRRALGQLGDWDKLGRGIDVSERRSGSSPRAGCTICATRCASSGGTRHSRRLRR